MSHAHALPSPPAPADTLDVELRRAGMVPEDAPISLRLGYAIAPLHADWVDVELDPAIVTHALVQGDLADLAVAEGAAARILLEGVLDRLPLEAAVDLLATARHWLAPEGELHLVLPDALVQLDRVLTAGDTSSRQRALASVFSSKRQDGWFGDKLHRVLTGLGYRMRSLRRGDDAQLEVVADRGPGPTASETVERILCAFEPRRRPRESYMAPVVAPAPKVSLLVLTFNALEDTKLCFASIDEHCTVPYELIVVDNASSDGTRAWLEAWAETRPQVTLVFNDDNRGFAGGNNQALALARGEYVVLLNNDTVVTEGWLERCIDIFEHHPEIGLIGPRSNRVSGAQLIREVPYRNEPEDLARMHLFARAWREHHEGRTSEAIRLVGFCLAARRAVIDAVGGLDERFGRGNFEDDDFCLRAHLAGFRACIAEDVFIHHSGSKSFRAAKIDYRAALEQNWTLFKTKWGISDDRRIEEGMPVTLHPPETAMDFIPLPTITTDHSPNTDGPLEGRAWQPTTPAASALVSMARAASCVAPAEPPAAEAPRVAPPVEAAAAPPPPAEEPHPLTALFDRAETAAKSGRWEEAANTFAEMVQLKPGFGPALVGFASSALAVGRIEEGIAALQQACGIYPDNISLRLQLGVAVAHTGDLIRAQAAFLEVLDIDPDQIDALVSLAHTCRVAKQYVEAVELLAHAARVAPENPDVIGAIGQTAFTLGDRAGAETALQELERLAPNHDETLMLRDILR